MSDKVVVFILSMHRSGSSGLAGALSHAGMYLGRRLKSAAYDNPKGYYEDEDIVQINEELLRLKGERWYAPQERERYPEDWDILIPRAKSLLLSFWKNHNVVVLKDPRFALTYEFWEKVVEQIGYSVEYIVLLRNPESIVSSLERRNYFSKEKAIALCEHYWLQIAKAVKGCKYISLDFDDFIKDERHYIHQIISQFSPDLDVAAGEESFIDTNLINVEFKEKTKSDFDSLWDIHSALISKNENELIEIKHKSVKLAPEIWEQRLHFVKILYDHGTGYQEKNSTLIEIGSHQDRIQIECPIKCDSPILSLSVLLDVAPIHITLSSIGLRDDKGVIPMKLSSNADYLSKGFYSFQHTTPQLFIELERPTCELVLYVDYKISVLKREDRSNRSLYLSLLSSIVRRPVSLLSELNAKNWQILKSAIKRESPRTILKNLLKLLSQQKEQEIIDDKGKQSALLKTRFEQIESRSLAVPKSQLVYITPELPSKGVSSGAHRAVLLLEGLSECFDIIVYYTGKDEVREDIQSANAIKLISHFQGSTRQLKKVATHVHALIYAHYYSYYDFQYLLKLYPASKVVIDSIDLHWVREERALDQGINGFDHKVVSKNKDREIKAYDSVDMVWVVSEAERTILRSSDSTIKSAVVSNIHKPEETKSQRSANKDFLFIGNFLHHPNQEALLRLIKSIWPVIYRDCPTTKLIIVGGGMREEMIHLLRECPFVDCRGLVSEEELRSIYSEVSAVVVPLLTGAGVKGKILEAIAFDTLVITNAIGNEGIGLKHGVSGLLAETDEDFILAIKEVIEEEIEVEHMRNHALQHVLPRFAQEKVVKSALHSLVPLIDICIVTWDQIDLLSQCIQSLIRNTRYPNHSVHIHSNGCTDGTWEYLEELSAQYDFIKIYRSDKNLGFVEPNNQIVTSLESDVVLLNNDTILTKDWLWGLYRASLLGADVGVVGSKLLYPDGRLQEFGSELYKNGGGRNIGKNEQDNYDRPTAVQYVSAASVYIKRTLIQEIGLFDKVYSPCYYEDSDYCFRAWQQGWATIVTPDSRVIHLEGGTAGRDVNASMKSYQKTNKQLFYTRHERSIDTLNKIIRRKQTALNKTIKKISYE